MKKAGILNRHLSGALAELGHGDGVLVCAGAHLVPTAEPEPLPKGLGTRHAAAAGITASTRAVALVVSQSTGALTVFRSGRLVADIHRPVGGTRLAL